MNLDLSAFGDFSRNVPQAIVDIFKGYFVPGAKTTVAKNNGDTIVVQEMSRPAYGLQYLIFKTSAKLELKATTREAELNAYIALKNDTILRVTGIGTLKLRQGEFILFHAPVGPIGVSCRENSETHVLALRFSKEIVSEFLPVFPVLKKFVRKAKKGWAFIPDTRATWAGFKTAEIARELLSSSYEGKLLDFFFDNKIRECLLVVLDRAGKAKEGAFNIGEEDKEAAYGIKELLDGNFDEHYTIPELARKAGMNAFKLKYIFKKLFGKGMFEYHRDQRLREAHRLLLDTNKPLKEVADLTGYARPTNFISEFRKYFQYTPGSLKRK